MKNNVTKLVVGVYFSACFLAMTAETTVEKPIKFYLCYYGIVLVNMLFAIFLIKKTLKNNVNSTNRNRVQERAD